MVSISIEATIHCNLILLNELVLAKKTQHNTKTIPKNTENSLKWLPEGTWHPRGSELGSLSEVFKYT